MNRRLSAVLAAAAVTLAACGGGSGDTSRSGAGDLPPAGDLQELVLTSAVKAADVRTAHFSFTAELPGPDGVPVSITGTGAVDNTVPLITMTMESAGPMPGEGEGDATTSFLFDGEMFYMRFPDALTASLGGKRWVRFDAATMSAGSGLDFDEMLAQFRTSDPLANLSLLAGATGDATEVGTEEVGGTMTRHVRVTVDMQKSLAAVDERFRPALEQLTRQTGMETMPVDVWIAGDGLPRRFAYGFDLSDARIPGAEGLTGTFRTTMEMFDYGKQVDVAVPPAEDTVDLAELIGQSGGY